MTKTEAVIHVIKNMEEQSVKNLLAKILQVNDIIAAQLFDGLVDAGLIFRSNGHFEIKKFTDTKIMTVGDE